jgi:hypothetical protein
MAVTDLARLLEETATHHDPYEKSAPPHHWWDWYAAYITARQGGSSVEDAERTAARHMETLL